MKPRRRFSLVLLSMVASISACDNSQADWGPLEGSYKGSDGLVYAVYTKGPTPLIVTREAGFCIMFYRYKERRIVEHKEMLTGRTCGNPLLEQDWLAGVDTSNREVLFLYLSRTDNPDVVEEIELNLERPLQGEGAER